MGISTTTIVLTALVCLAFLPSVQAFGAGNVPTFSFLEGKAFRHGDIEDTLATLLKKSGGIFGGSKFGGLDIKHVYFGNWLRDYSQAMDLAGLQKLSKQTIINLLMGLGFLAHGYATKEFEVTEERLGVYLPVEHIDNPSGYAADQPGGDARRTDPRLRGPIDPRELEIDPSTGMKNYIANERGGWDTSARYVRDNVKKCIDMGRRAKDSGRDEDLFEAYRLLGGFLHTLEDFTAHSNWCELSLRRLGHTNVFCHVGAGVILQTPGGPAPPLVTGTFGGADFLHSIMGEATDKISEASVSDLTKKMDDAKASTNRGSSTDELSKLLFSLPSGGGELNTEMQDVQQIRDRAASGQGAPMSPQELHATLWKVLSFRDNVVKTIESTIEKIPGLSSVVEKLTNAINKFIFTTLEPLLKPIMTSASAVLFEGSAKVLNDSDQYAVFDRMDATDPTHSFLAKDHFNNILNEIAGKVSIVVIAHAVKAVVNAWEEKSVDPNNVATEILEAFHHPYFFNDRSAVQREMATTMKEWINSKTGIDKQYILDSLTAQSVRNHKNVVKGTENLNSEGGHQHSGGCHSESNSILNAPVQRIMNFGSGGGIGGGQGYQGAHQNVDAGGYPGAGRRRDVGDGDSNGGGFQQQQQGGHSQYSSGGGNDYQQHQQPDYQQQQNQGYTPSYDQQQQQQQPQYQQQQQQQQYDQYGNPIQQYQQSGNGYGGNNYSNQQGGGGNYQQGGNGGYQQQQGGYGGGQSGY